MTTTDVLGRVALAANLLSLPTAVAGLGWDVPVLSGAALLLAGLAVVLWTCVICRLVLEYRARRPVTFTRAELRDLDAWARECAEFTGELGDGSRDPR